MLWQRSSIAAHVLRELGTTFETERDRLGAAAIWQDPPPFDDRRWGPLVYLTHEELGPVLKRLSKLLPNPIDIGWNIDEERAWVHTTEGVDLEEIVEQIRSELSGAH